MVTEIGPDLSYAAASAWVKDMPDDQVVGSTRKAGFCPLAVLATSQGMGAPHIHTFLGGWGVYAGGRPAGAWGRPTTEFEERFIAAVDTGGPHVGSPVTAGQVRAILAELVPEFGPQVGES